MGFKIKNVSGTPISIGSDTLQPGDTLYQRILSPNVDRLEVYGYVTLEVVDSDTSGFSSSLLSGENQQFDVMAAHEIWAYRSCAADTLVSTGPTIYGGCTVIAALSAATCEIRDAVAAATGTIIDILAASSPVGTSRVGGILCPTGLFVDFNGTGTVVIRYRSVAA